MECRTVECDNPVLIFKVMDTKNRIIYFERNFCFWCAVDDADKTTGNLSRVCDVELTNRDTRDTFRYNPMTYEGDMPSWVEA